MLTDKTRELFLEWYAIEFEKRNLPYINGFDISDLSIQFGVYCDFFRSKDVIIGVYPLLDYNGYVYTKVLYWSINVIVLNAKIENDNFTEYSKEENAQKAAIEKANDLINSI